MGILQLIMLIFSMLRYLPQFVSIVKAIIELIKELRGSDNTYSEKGLLKELILAIKLAKEKGDMKALEDLQAKLLDLLSRRKSEDTDAPKHASDSAMPGNPTDTVSDRAYTGFRE